MKKMTLMFHIGRSGSTVLGDMLSRTEGLTWHKEIYESLFRKIVTESDNPLSQLQLIDPYEYLMEHTQSHPTIVHGFEVKFFHVALFNISLKNFIAHSIENGINDFIILERKNYLRKIVSSLIARQNKSWHLTDTHRRQLTQITMDPHKISIDRSCGTLLSYLERFEKSFAHLRKLLIDRNLLELTYEEDIEKQPQLAYQKTCAFLGLQPQDITNRFQRINPFPLSDILINHSEIEDYLKDTPYAWMLKS